jgi:hypothetical protein
MLAKHHQLHPPYPKASRNAFQALVDPPHHGNNLSFDAGDERTDGSDDNTIVNAYPRDSGPPALVSLQKDIDTLGHLDRTATALAGFPTTILRLAENYDTNDLYMHELNRQLIAICDGETNAHDDDRVFTDYCFATIESKMDSLLQKMDIPWTQNTTLRKAYHASREETALLKAAVDTLTKKLDESTAMFTPPSPETVTTSTIMEEMTMQLSRIPNDIQDVLDAVHSPPNNRKRCTGGQDNEPMMPTNRQLATQ